MVVRDRRFASKARKAALREAAIVAEHRPIFNKFIDIEKKYASAL